MSNTTSRLVSLTLVCALNTLAKHHGLLTDKTEITGKDGEAIQVKFVDYRAGLNGTSEA